MAHKLRENQELQALQERYIGTGSANTSDREFRINQHRDTLNSFIGHPALLQYAAIGLGKTKEQTRVEFLERMVRPIKPATGEKDQGRKT